MITRIETGEVKFVVKQMIEGVLKGAGQKLPFEINGNKARAGVNVFIARPGCLLDENINALIISFEFAHNAQMTNVFLQPR